MNPAIILKGERMNQIHKCEYCLAELINDSAREGIATWVCPKHCEIVTIRIKCQCGNVYAIHAGAVRILDGEGPIARYVFNIPAIIPACTNCHVPVFAIGILKEGDTL